MIYVSIELQYRPIQTDLNASLLLENGVYSYNIPYRSLITLFMSNVVC